MKKRVDLKIHCGRLLPIHPENIELTQRTLIINNGKIEAITSYADSEEYEASEVISAEKQLVLPGFINTHTHIGMAYFKGLGDDLPLESWLKDHIWPAEDKYINAEFIYKSSLHGIGELIKNGTTCFNDMYFITEETAKACINTGMRGVLGGGVILDFPLGEYHKPEEFIEIFNKNIEFIKDSTLVNVTVAPHSVYTVNQETWKIAIEMARQGNFLLHTHLCETEKEIFDCKKRYGKSPVQFLYDLGAFDTKFIFAHGIYLEDNDFALITGKDCSLAVNLHSNLKLASGIPPLAKYIKHDINISFGTDSVASNNVLSISDEISTAGKLYKAYYKDAAYLPAKELVKMATINAAKALGLEDRIGSIEIGKEADIICIDINNFQCQPVYDPFSYIVYGMNRGNISTVVVQGRVLMKDKKLQTIDEEELLNLNLYR